MSDERLVVGFISLTEFGNFKVEIFSSRIKKLSAIHKTSEDKLVFVALLDGEEMRCSQQSNRPMKRVCLTVPKPVKSTKRNLKKTAKLLDFTVFELLESRKEPRQR